MEGNRSSTTCLKQRLARMLRAPTSLLHSSCNASTSAATILSSTASSRPLLINDVAHDPAFVPCRRRRRLQAVDDDCSTLQFVGDGLGRSRSFSCTPKALPPGRRVSVDCGGCRPGRDHLPPLIMAKNEKWRKEGKSKKKKEKKERRVRETGGLYETGEWEGTTCPPASPSSPSKSSSHYYYYCFNGAVKEEDEQKSKISVEKKTEKKKKKKLLSNAYGFSSSSSADSDEGDDFFSSCEEGQETKEETETFFSSRSFSSDSSEFYQRPLPNSTRNSRRRRKKQQQKKISSSSTAGFRPVVSVSSEEKKKKKTTKKTKARDVKEAEKRGFAVVKRSNDPYADFRSSMVEMIIERQIFGAEDLEQLLQSYLFLNSPLHHPLIFQAFSDIWVVLFGS